MTYQTSSKKVKDGPYIRYNCKYDVYKTNVNTGERQCIKKDISSVPDLKISSDGNFYYLEKNQCLYGIKNGNPVKLHQFDRYIGIVSIIGSTVYYDYVEDNTTYLAYYDINTHASGIAASHRAASSGQFFNW